MSTKVDLLDDNKPTLLYLDFVSFLNTVSKDKKTFDFVSFEKFLEENKQYLVLKKQLSSLNPDFISNWDKLECILFEHWGLLAENGSLYFKLPYDLAHYVKVLLDELFGRKNFLNEIIWVNPNPKKNKVKGKWIASHETILVYVKDKNNYIYNTDSIDREPYMAPSLVTKEKAEKGKLPTDTWWNSFIGNHSDVFVRIVKASTNENDKVLLPFESALGKTLSSLNRKLAL